MKFIKNYKRARLLLKQRFMRVFFVKGIKHVHSWIIFIYLHTKKRITFCKHIYLKKVTQKWMARKFKNSVKKVLGTTRFVLKESKLQMQFGIKAVCMTWFWWIICPYLEYFSLETLKKHFKRKVHKINWIKRN